LVFAFGDHRLDLKRRELRRAGELVGIEPKVFDLLAFLVQHRDRVVSRDDLIEGVWQGRVVSDSAVTTRINAARRAVGDDGTAQRLIRTFTRKGVRFMGDVAEIPELPPRAVPERAEAATAPPGRASVRADQPSIAVLPFQNLSGDPAQDYFVDGMVEEIITALSRIRWLFVLARNSSFTYKGQAIDVKQVGRDLAVDYVLEGSVRKAGSRVRITGQLIDASTGAHLWADRFEGQIQDVFDLQDKVASSVAGIIEPELRVAEAARAAKRPTSDLTAYDLYLRAYEIFLSSTRQIPEALRLLEQAIDRDPRYRPALALAGMCCFALLRDSRSENAALDRAKGIDFARRALEGSSDDPGVLATAAVALAYFGEDIGAMMALVDRALAINPNFARGWHIAGLLRVWAGEPDDAIRYLEAALRLSPRARIGTSANLIGLAHFFAGRFEEAVPQLLLAIQADPSFPSPYRVLAACYAHLGRLNDAREVVERLRAITPALMPDASHFRKTVHREILLSGLRAATSRPGS
jgi:TolB-like protein/tetratricopeptide (TPR) repeat protein